MIYSHKPQRSGKSITSNTNNPPQDPPPPKKQIPDVLIKDTISIPEIIPCKKVPEIIEKPIKTSKKPKVTPKIIPKVKPKIIWRNRIVSLLKKLFRRT